MAVKSPPQRLSVITNTSRKWLWNLPPQRLSIVTNLECNLKRFNLFQIYLQHRYSDDEFLEQIHSQMTKSIHTYWNTVVTGGRPSNSMSSHILYKSSCTYISPPPPPYFCKPTPNSHIQSLDAQTIQSAKLLHISHTLNTQITVQILTAISVPRHSTHPSHHHMLRPLQNMQMFCLHCPGFSPICQHTPYTSSVNLFLVIT